MTNYRLDRRAWARALLHGKRYGAGGESRRPTCET